MSLNIKILIATHKKTLLPIDPIYLPVHVGREGKKELGYQGDNGGENISSRNSRYSELTAVYWAWKNLEADYVGLVHYRRLFTLKKNKNIWEHLLNSEQAQLLCQNNEIILPAKRNYYIETLFSHYAHTHDINHLNLARKIIAERQPSYLDSFDKVMGRKWGHLFNMFIMKKDKFDSYCAWLFPILFELETNVDYTGLSPFDARLLGRVSEFLLDIWILENKYEYVEINWIQAGKTNIYRKINVFLAAKFLNRKYKNSQ